MAPAQAHSHAAPRGVVIHVLYFLSSPLVDVDMSLSILAAQLAQIYEGIEGALERLGVLRPTAGPVTEPMQHLESSMPTLYSN